MQSKERQIEEIRLYPIFDISEQEARKYDRLIELKGLRNPSPVELLSNSLYENLFFPCLNLAKGNIITANKIYRTMDLVRLWQLLAIKKAYDFRATTLQELDREIKRLNDE